MRNVLRVGAIGLILISAVRLHAQQSKADLPPYTPDGSEPTVVVLDFENSTFFDSPAIGPSIATMFQTALVRSRRARVIERGNLQGLQSQPVDYARVSEISGAGYVVTGTVKLFRVVSVGSSTKVTEAGDSSTSGFGGSLTGRELTATVTVQVNYVEAATGRTLYTQTTTATETSTSSAIGVVYHTVAATIAGGIEGFDQTIGGIATRNAANQVLAEMVRQGVFSRR